MKKILITGITGFVGTHLASQLLSQKSYEIIGTYRSESGLSSLAQFGDTLRLRKVDLNDTEAVEKLLQDTKPDVIFHLAAQASPAKSFAIPVETLTNNIVAEFSLLNSLRKLELRLTRVVVISSAEIYGVLTPQDIPVDEDTPFRPATPYAVSKLAQDFLSYQHFLAYNMDIVRLRPYNHIGPGQKEGYVVADFAKQIAQIEKSNKEEKISVGNLQAKRDFTDVRDMVKAYALAMEKGISGEVYNIGSGKSRKIEDILHTLLSFSKRKISVTIDQSRFRPIDVPEIRCDSSKFHKLTGWKPTISFEKTLDDILDYWRKIV
jgi:GDP-4-dehydro-6-deoxy-D-mannose reductase